MASSSSTTSASRAAAAATASRLFPTDWSLSCSLTIEKLYFDSLLMQFVKLLYLKLIKPVSIAKM